jgi:hypothetical protein
MKLHPMLAMDQGGKGKEGKRKGKEKRNNARRQESG